jgi:alpha-L-fucosidase
MNNRFVYLSIMVGAVFLFVAIATKAQTGATAKDTIPLNLAIGEAGNAKGFDMAPETNIKVVEGAVEMIPANIKTTPGPVKPTWESLKANYKVPQWAIGAKFGIFMHWGLYSVPAYHNEWYEKHMYTNGGIGAWHVAHFGPQDKFGYKDFIPLFTQDKFDPDAWASLFKRSGARFVIPTAEHHDNFALWDSQVTPFNSVQMGPKRDLIGDLCKAVRKQGMKFGVSNHGIENFQFINPPADMIARLKAEKADLFDPKWVDFYHVADRSDTACKKFLVDWYERNVELINKYQPDILWFDNGVDQRFLDPMKLQIAAYYYNKAKTWRKDVSLSTKKAAYAPAGTNTQTIGSIIDFEKTIPADIRTGVWQLHNTIGSTWGYTEGMRVSGPAPLIATLVDVASKNGTVLLNISPKADGTIPQDQQETLLGIGKWLDVNGEAIYDTHNWIKFGEGGQGGELKIRFTVNGDVLYAIIVGKWPGAGAIAQITSLANGKAPGGKIKSITMLGAAGQLAFTQDATALKVTLPANAPCDVAYTLKITGLKMNAPTWTASGNPIADR